MVETLTIEECVFYVHDGRAAVELPGVSRMFERAAYDGKNTLRLWGTDGSVCVAENIVPEVRDVLGKSAGVLVVNRDEKGDIAGGYLLKLIPDCISLTSTVPNLVFHKVKKPRQFPH